VTLVEGPPRLVPGIAYRFSCQIPAPGDYRRDTHIDARTKHSLALERLLSVTVDANTSRDKRFQGRHVVDDERNLVITRRDVAKLARVANSVSTPNPENVSVELHRERYSVGLAIAGHRRQVPHRLRLQVCDLFVSKRHGRFSFLSSVPRSTRRQGPFAPGGGLVVGVGVARYLRISAVEEVGGSS